MPWRAVLAKAVGHEMLLCREVCMGLLVLTRCFRRLVIKANVTDSANLGSAVEKAEKGFKSSIMSTVVVAGVEGGTAAWTAAANRNVN